MLNIVYDNYVQEGSSSSSSSSSDDSDRESSRTNGLHGTDSSLSSRFEESVTVSQSTVTSHEQFNHQVLRESTIVNEFNQQSRKISESDEINRQNGTTNGSLEEGRVNGEEESFIEVC